jgi:glycosyltransferase involved in cell wall biosynthesis
VPALLETGGDLELTVFAGNEGHGSLAREPWAGDIELVRVPVSSQSRPLRALAEQTLLPRAARKARLDLLHNTLNTAPALPGLPQLTTIHDVIYKRFPETAGRLNAGVALLVTLAARRSELVLTDSEASKRDLIDLLAVDPTRVVVVPLGPGLPEPPKPLEQNEVRTRLELGDVPIVLTVAAKRPHKNLDRLLEAFAQVETDALLVVPGFETAFESELKQRAGERVRFVGWLDDDMLDGLYRTATCFVLPSLAEGFGLPVLEAMARGTPVGCSRASSLPEVGGGAALYFDPLDTGAIATALGQLLGDAELRAHLREAGIARAAEFSWQRTAEATLEQYERAVALR